jgi:hypothetical protein
MQKDNVDHEDPNLFFILWLTNRSLKRNDVPDQFIGQGYFVNKYDGVWWYNLASDEECESAIVLPGVPLQQRHFRRHSTQRALHLVRTDLFIGNGLQDLFHRG